MLAFTPGTFAQQRFMFLCLLAEVLMNTVNIAEEFHKSA